MWTSISATSTHRCIHPVYHTEHTKQKKDTKSIKSFILKYRYIMIKHPTHSQRVEMVAYALGSMHPPLGTIKRPPELARCLISYTCCATLSTCPCSLLLSCLVHSGPKWHTESPAAVKPAGAPFCMPGPCTPPLSFLPRGEGAVTT